MEDVQVPQDFLSEFLNSQPVNGTGSDDGVPEKVSGAFDKGMAWLMAKVDQAAKDQGLPGLEGMKPAEIAELVTIVLEKHFGASFKKHSPEIMLATVISGTILHNAIAYQRLVTKRQKEQQEKEKQAENE